MVVKCDGTVKMGLWYKSIYANAALNNFAYFFYKFSLFGVGTLNKINIFFNYVSLGL